MHGLASAILTIQSCNFCLSKSYLFLLNNLMAILFQVDWRKIQLMIRAIGNLQVGPCFSCIDSTLPIWYQALEGMFSWKVKDSKNGAQFREEKTVANTSTVQVKAQQTNLARRHDEQLQERREHNLKSWHDICKFVASTSADKPDLLQHCSSSLELFCPMIIVFIVEIESGQ